MGVAKVSSIWHTSEGKSSIKPRRDAHYLLPFVGESFGPLLPNSTLLQSLKKCPIKISYVVAYWGMGTRGFHLGASRNHVAR